MNMKIIRGTNRVTIVGIEEVNKPFKINGEIWERIIEKFPMNVKSTIRVMNENLILKTPYENGSTITIKLIDGNRCKIIIDSSDNETLENIVNAIVYDIASGENEYDVLKDKPKNMYISFIERAMNDCILKTYKKKDVKKFIIESLFDDEIVLTGKGIQSSFDTYKTMIEYLSSTRYDVDDVILALDDDMDLTMSINKDDINGKSHLYTIHIVNKNEVEIDDAIISASSNKVELEEFNKLFNDIFGNVEIFPSYFSKLLVKWLPHANNLKKNN